MDNVEWSRMMADIFFAHQDPQGELQKFRHQIPPFVLRTFCDNTASGQQMWIYDQNQIPTCVVNTVVPNSDSETLIIYRPATREFERRRWTESFGAEQIYSRFFDNLTTQRYMREAFDKFELIQQVDRDIFQGLVDPIWQIQSLQPQGTITLRRDDVWTLRKFLHLMTNLHGRDRTMHLLAHAPEMEDARIRRKRFIESRGMEHPRDVWLYNAEQTLKTPHHEVHQNTGIFDLDREDYRANARERFLVFWEAGPGDEFILTENGFGGFEGGQIGARQDSIINMGSRELEQHMYTRDFMWHQLYVLSPTLVAALCHGTLMHPDLTRAQRKRWGLRRSLLENLPHEVAPKYYKDMTKGDASFIKPGFPVPQDVEWAFGINVSLEKRKADEIEFPVQRLSPKQVSMVNSVLLHNQHNGPIVKSVCLRSPPQYQSLYNSLVMFQQQPWEKYSDEEQNDYTALTERLRVFLQPTVPEPLSAHLQYAQQQQQQQAQQFHQLPPHQLHQMPSMPMPIPPMQPPMSDPRRIYAGDRSMTMPEVPRYEQPIHESRPMDLRANSQMSHSSHSSSFTPSSQSSQTYSSASSQTSSSSATSIEPHRFETKPVPAAAAREPKSRPQSPSRKNEKPRKGNSQTENVPTKPAKPAQAPKVANIVIEHTVQEIQERHRGRQASRSDPPPPPPQIKVSPIPDRVELTASKPKPRHQPEQTKPQEPQQKPQTQPQQKPQTQPQQKPQTQTQQKPQTQPQQKPQTQTQTQQTQPQPPQQQQHQPQQQHQKQQHQKQQHQKQQPMQQQQQQQKPQSQPMQQQQSQPQPMQQRFQPQSVLQQNPLPQPVQQKASVLPERPMYVMDVMDPMRPIQTEHERNEPVPQWNFSGVELQGPQYDMGLPESRAHSQQSQRSTSQTNEHSSQSSEHVRQRQYETERQYEVLMQDLQSHPQPCDRNSQTSETARRQQYDSPRPELGQIQRPIPPTDRHSADTVSSRGRPYEPPRPEQGQIQRPLQRPSPVGDGRKVEQSQPMRNTASHERSYHYESKPEQQQSQPMRNTGSHDRSHQYEPKPEQQSQPMRNTMSHDRSSYSSEHARQRQYEFELLKPEQPKPPPVPAHKTQPQILKPQPQRPVNHNISTEAPAGAVDESRGRPYEVITPEGLQPQKQQQQQRSPNSSGERQMRPGVEIVRPHTLEPVRPEPRSNLQPSQAQQKPQYIDNAKVKQLRFDARTLSHKLSDMSLDGSMIVQTGDDNETDMSGSESESEDDEDGQTIGGEEEDDAWEDEGFAESEELSNTKPKSTKPHVRFADRPLSRTGMRGVPIHIERPLSRLGFAAHLGRKVDFIERPSSRLGRRVEIVRPLSRNGQRANMGLAGKGRQTHGHGGVHAHR